MSSLARVRSARYAALACFMWAIASTSGAAQNSPCDKGLEGLGHGPNGYALRGDRCEGIYIQQVGGTVLWVASYTQSFESYELTSGADLVIEWSTPADAVMRLRAQGVKHDLYYRMDAVRSAAPRSYHWPSDVLAAQRISREDIGVLGWIRQPIGGVERDVYVPLRIAQHSTPRDTALYELVLFPTVRLNEVYVTLATVGADGHPLQYMKKGQPLHYGYYPPEQPIPIELRDQAEAGVYYLEISADLTNGGSVALTHWIYYGRARHER